MGVRSQFIMIMKMNFISIMVTNLPLPAP